MASWEPSPDHLSTVLVEQNPWYTTGAVPGSFAPETERPLVEGVVKALGAQDRRRFQLILGPRRVGKATVMYQAARSLLRRGIAPNRLWWVRLDHPLLLDVDLGVLAKLAIQLAGGSDRASTRPAFIFLDELVYAKKWDLWLKTFYDEQWPVRIVASSSAVAALQRQHVESGVGRWDERYLTPYLLSEYLTLRDTPIEPDGGQHLGDALEGVLADQPDRSILRAALRELLFTGGFPDLLVRFRGGSERDEERLVESQRVLRADAVERAIYKDIPQSFGVDNPMQLERLLYAVAGQATGLLSPTKIATQLRMTEPTIDRYLSYLERSFILFLLPNYGTEMAKQRRGRRLYFYDSAIRNAALERGLAPLNDATEMGVLYENVAASHLQCLSLLSLARCYHWREGNTEVDLIYDDIQQPIAFEIASRPEHSRKGLSALIERHPQFKGNAWLVSPDGPAVSPSTSRDGIGQIPLPYLLVAIGAHFNRRLRASL